MGETYRLAPHFFCRVMSQPRSFGTFAAGAVALAAWASLFHFGGVTDIGYDASNPIRSAFVWLFVRWREDFRLTSYAINFLAPPLALWLAWRRRAVWMSGPHQVSFGGLALLLLGLALHALGAKAQQTRISLFAMIVTLYGTAWFAWGRPAARGLAMPAAALLFALPFNFLDQLVIPLRIASVMLTALLASGLGLPVTATGSLLVESEQRAWAIDLADSAGSIFALLAITLWSVALAEWMLPSWKRRLALVALTPLFFVIASILRGFLLCLLAEGVSPHAATRIATGYSGLILALAILPAQLVAARLLRMKKSDLQARLRTLIAQGPSATSAPPPTVDRLP